MTWRFFIPKQLPTLNDHIVNFGKSRWKYAKERDEWVMLLRNASRLYQITRCDMSKRSLVVTRVFGGRQRELDYLNFCGGAKSCIDAFALTGLLHDDAPKWLADTYLQRKAEPGEASGTWFELADMPAANAGVSP